MQRMTCLTKVVLRARTHTRLFQHLTAAVRPRGGLGQPSHGPKSSFGDTSRWLRGFRR